MGAAQFTILLLVALFNIQHLHAGVPADFCSRKSDGNYLCPPSDASDAKTGTVCACRGRESCDDGEWFDPAEDACCSSKDFLRKLIRCMNDGKDAFINPTDLPVPDATFCSQKEDGNYLCDPDRSSDVCSCFYGRKCNDGQWYDPKKPFVCSTLTNDVLAKLTTCIGLPADTTPIQPEITITPTEGVCPNGYEGPTDEGFCYKAILTAMTWDVAKDRCSQELSPGSAANSRPAYALNKQQNDDIVEYLLKFRGNTECDISNAEMENYFIGGHRKNEDECSQPKGERTDDFEWTVDDTPPVPISNYTNWEKGEPNCSNGLAENCMAYRCGHDGLSQCFWLDYWCQNTACLLCQVKV